MEHLLLYCQSSREVWEKISQMDINKHQQRNNILWTHGKTVQQTRILLDGHLHPRNKFVENKVHDGDSSSDNVFK